MKPARKADLLILLSALLWGGEYVIVKDMVDYFPPNWINAIRFLLAAPLLFLLFPGRILKISRGEVKAGILLGFFLFGGFTLQTIGIQYTSASKSGFITSTYVVMVPFAYWLLKQRFPGVRAFVGASICLAGIGLISLDGKIGINRGDWLTLLAAVSFTGSILGFDYYSKKYDPINLTFMEMLAGGLMSLIPALTFETFPVISGFGIPEILQMLYLVLFGSLVCHVASNVAMKWTESTHASILWSLESVFALIFAVIFLQEQLSLLIIAGFVLIFSAVILSETG
jgi:drug/metabolite transporter (DMT)-like permease